MPQDLRRFYDAACGRSRTAATGCRTGLILRRADGSHRSGSIHMIEETGRHNGHVDLVREAIDGFVGE
jgi:hypothetical protein